MPAVAFDTLRFTKRLLDAGVALELASATAEAFKEASSEADLATHRDIELLQGDIEQVKVSIERLEERMDARFAQADTKMETRLAQMDAKMEAGFAQMDAKMEAGLAQANTKMDTGFAQMDAKMEAGLAQANTKMDTGLAQMDARMETRFAQVESRLDQVDTRFDHLETNLNGRIDSMEQRMTIKLGGMMVVAVGAITALVKLL
uniref:DUF1640 domain-containing protein n=1 Tax=Candidatus Kentrum sp. UNK TaxID=2126344 RepID=A0A451AU20_9GAMM|nr:MAG: hypothetical protein BECKUNK1418G_GA0071005_101413 [Candidatus Kentron sp. UNK]VFK69533.1 MAG: hypothetical protein BECKUNK1418H_GA0071006_101532 [Candidatus Kentron sp. UNK]